MCKLSSAVQPQLSVPSQLAQNATPPQGPPGQMNALPASGNMQIAIPVRDDSNVVQASFEQPVGAKPVSAQSWSATPPPGTLTNPFADGRSAMPGANSPQAGSAVDAKLVAASVRLRIEDAGGNSCGSGTIIDSRSGEALILTCGHIFRDSQGKGKIEVDLFGPYSGQRVAGRLISYDLQKDVGLVAIQIPNPIAAARLAPPGYKINKGNKVASVGCDNGKDPAVWWSYVTSLNRYTGPSNIQVAGQPTEGRSGGGLFSMDGMVIGVCNARDPQDQEGFYAALDTISAQLDQAGLAFVYQSPQSQEGLNNTTPLMAGINPAASLQQMSRTVAPATSPSIQAGNLVQPMAAPVNSTVTLNQSEQAALEEIRRRVKEGAEVVCIVRSRNNPQTKSEVIMIDKASPEFIEQLAAEAQTQEGRQLTSLEVTRPKQPALEWSNNANGKGWRSGQ